MCFPAYYRKFCVIKKLKQPAGQIEKPAGKSERVTLNDVTMAGLERGLTMQDIRRMTIGQVVDFCIDWNDRKKRAEKAAKKGKKRKATQEDIDAFFGR